MDKKIADVLRVSMGPALSLLYLPLLYLDEAQRFELILSRVDPNHNSEHKLDKVFSEFRLRKFYELIFAFKMCNS